MNPADRLIADERHRQAIARGAERAKERHSAAHAEMHARLRGVTERAVSKLVALREYHTSSGHFAGNTFVAGGGVSSRDVRMAFAQPEPIPRK